MTAEHNKNLGTKAMTAIKKVIKKEKELELDPEK